MITQFAPRVTSKPAGSAAGIRGQEIRDGLLPAPSGPGSGIRDRNQNLSNPKEVESQRLAVTIYE